MKYLPCTKQTTPSLSFFAKYPLDFTRSQARYDEYETTVRYLEQNRDYLEVRKIKVFELDAYVVGVSHIELDHVSATLPDLRLYVEEGIRAWVDPALKIVVVLDYPNINSLFSR